MALSASADRPVSRPMAYASGASGPALGALGATSSTRKRWLRSRRSRLARAFGVLLRMRLDWLCSMDCALSDGLDGFGGEVDDLIDLRLLDHQRRRHGDGVARLAHHQAELEGLGEGLVAARPDGALGRE